MYPDANVEIRGNTVFIWSLIKNNKIPKHRHKWRASIIDKSRNQKMKWVECSICEIRIIKYVKRSENIKGSAFM